jgi:6-phospho-3-hexuloisomerase
MDVQALARGIADEALDLITKVDNDAAEHFVGAFDRADRIFCGACGRSGFVLRCFCMRLMHLGYRAYFVGETVTPPIAESDLLIVLSGSGETPWTCEWVNRARQANAVVCAIVGTQDSSIGRSAHQALCLPASSKSRPRPGRLGSGQPIGSAFEQAAFVLLESVVLALYKRQGGNPGGLLDRHANLE